MPAHRLRRLRVSRSTGQGLVEYALIILFIAIALVAGLTAMAGGLDGAYASVVAAL